MSDPITNRVYVWQALTGKWHYSLSSTLDERGTPYDSERKAREAGKQRLAEREAEEAQ